MWVEGVLDVALTHHAQVPDDLDSRGPEDVILPVGERLAGRDHDGLARMDAQRVQVLHVADLTREERKEKKKKCEKGSKNN